MDIFNQKNCLNFSFYKIIFSQLFFVKIGNADIIIKEDPYKGNDLYWSEVSERYRTKEIFILNLLRCIPGSPETSLSEVRIKKFFFINFHVKKKKKSIINNL